MDSIFALSQQTGIPVSRFQEALGLPASHATFQTAREAFSTYNKLTIYASDEERGHILSEWTRLAIQEYEAVTTIAEAAAAYNYVPDAVKGIAMKKWRVVAKQEIKQAKATSDIARILGGLPKYQSDLVKAAEKKRRELSQKEIAAAESVDELASIIRTVSTETVGLVVKKWLPLATTPQLAEELWLATVQSSLADAQSAGQHWVSISNQAIDAAQTTDEILGMLDHLSIDRNLQRKIRHRAFLKWASLIKTPAEASKLIVFIPYASKEELQQIEVVWDRLSLDQLASVKTKMEVRQVAVEARFDSDIKKQALEQYFQFDLTPQEVIGISRKINWRNIQELLIDKWVSLTLQEIEACKSPHEVKAILRNSELLGNGKKIKEAAFNKWLVVSTAVPELSEMYSEAGDDPEFQNQILRKMHDLV